MNQLHLRAVLATFTVSIAASVSAQTAPVDCTKAWLTCNDGLNGVVACINNLTTSNDCCADANKLDKCFEPLGGPECKGVASEDLGLAKLLAACLEAPPNGGTLGAVLPGVRLPESVEVSQDCFDSFKPCKEISLRNCDSSCCDTAKERVKCYKEKTSDCDNAELTVGLESIQGMVETEQARICGEALPAGESPSTSVDPSMNPSENSTLPEPSVKPSSTIEDCAKAILSCSTWHPLTLVCENGGNDCCDQITRLRDCKASIDQDECLGRGEQSEEALFSDVDEDDCSGVCFPGKATVTMDDGTMRRMDELEIGDRVLTGDGFFEEVFFFSHRQAHKRSTFVQVTTASGPTLRLSPSHLIPTSERGLVAASSLISGRDMVLLPGHTTLVTAAARVVDTGLFNPHTRARVGSTIVVDGVIASQYTTTISPSIAALLLQPVQAVYRLTDVHLKLPAFTHGLYLAAKKTVMKEGRKMIMF